MAKKPLTSLMDGPLPILLGFGVGCKCALWGDIINYGFIDNSTAWYVNCVADNLLIYYQFLGISVL